MLNFPEQKIPCSLVMKPALFFFKEQNMCSYENRRVWLDAGSRPKKQPRIASICQHKMWKWTTKKEEQIK